MRRPIALLASVLVVAFIFLSSAVPVLAADAPSRDLRSGNSTIAVNDYAVIGEFTTDQSQTVTPTISYSVFVIGNLGQVNYDILLMDQANYTHYTNHQNFTYISEGSKLSQSGRSVSVSDVPLAQNTHFFLVADNTNLPVGGSNPTQELRIAYILNTYDASIQLPTGNFLGLALIALVIIAIVVIVIVVVVLYLLLRKKKNGPQAMPPAPVQPAINPATAEGNCPVCGKPVSPDFMLCPNCGNRLK